MMRKNHSQHFIALLLLTLAFNLAPRQAWATDYYVSNSGNDANSGTSPDQAWQTLGRLAQIQYSMQPGDQILLERGGVYRGALPLNSSGTASSPISVGAYGSGEDPVVSGSTLVSNWEPYQGNVWRAQVAGTVKQVYANGKFMTMARYPNTGWLRMDQGTATTLDDADLAQADGYWNGATAVIRASLWSYDLATVTSYANGSLSFPSINESPGNYQWGYFLRNKLSELDAPEEWYFDAQAGMLYLQAPNNADPNSIQVEAAVLDSGAYVGWEREYINIHDISFRHQTYAGVEIDGGHHINVNGCSFRNLLHGIRSYGTYNTYTNCTIRNTLGIGAELIDQHSTFSGNQLDSIAMIPGSGRTNWGYFGIDAKGSDNTISDNRLNHIGYIGIGISNNSVAERNVVQNCVAILNDGGGISFDQTDGAIIRDNIVTDIAGNLESVAPDFPNYIPITFGIYFGNTRIKNTLVQGNTVTRCAGAGIHVDHSMGNTGNAVMDNILYDNGIQLSISDWSNNVGPDAVPPYYVPQFDETYSGNTLYCLTKDQLCMRQYNTHADGPVDFGTFSNNRYYNPYNELSIFLYNTHSGFNKYYTLEQWQEHTNDDAGSTRSPLRLNAMGVISTVGGELVDNGSFNANVAGWGGWPTNAEVTHATSHLDGGCLKANLPNSSMASQFSLRNPVAFPVVAGKWYRMSFSLISDISGKLNAAAKGVNQLSGFEAVGKRDYPFSNERRDIDMIFQSNLTDQAVVQFTNKIENPHYWLDNVSVKQVQVETLDPNDKQILLYSDHASAETFQLDGCWSDLDGNYHNGSISVPGFHSIVLVKEGDDLCQGVPTGTDDGFLRDKGFAYPNPLKPGGRLYLPKVSSGLFRIFRMNGQVVFKTPIGGNPASISIPAKLQPGVYIASVEDHGNATHFKLVVQ